MPCQVEVSYGLFGEFLELNACPVVKVEKDDLRQIATVHLDAGGLTGPCQMIIKQRSNGEQDVYLVPEIPTLPQIGELVIPPGLTNCRCVIAPWLAEPDDKEG